MKRKDIFILFLAIIIFGVIAALVISGLIVSFAVLLISLLFGLFVISSISILLIRQFSKKVETLSSCLYIIRRNMKENITPWVDSNIQKRCNEEIHKLKAKIHDPEVKEILCHEHFFRILSNWDKPDTIATFHVIDSLRDLSNGWFDTETAIPIIREFIDIDEIKYSVIEKFDYDVGCWFSSEEFNKPSIETAYAVLKTVGTFLWLNGSRPTFENFSLMIGEKRIKKFEQYLRDCFVRASGGFMDFGEEKATIGTTGLVLRIFNMLYNEGKKSTDKFMGKELIGLLDLKDASNIISFIMHCLKKIDVSGRSMEGFSETTDEGKPWICNSYFAVSALSIMGQEDLLTEPKTSGMIRSFLDSCLKTRTVGDDGELSMGYVASPDYNTENLLHTCYAMKIADKICPKYLQEKEDEYFISLIRFIDTCKMGNGFAFRMGWAPNVFATCMSRNLYFIIKRFFKKGNIKYDPREAINLYKACFRGRKLGFTGYPFVEGF